MSERGSKLEARKPEEGPLVDKEADQATQAEVTATVIRRASSFEGPIPDPETLARYEQIEAGLANRIMQMAEGELAHRHDMERAALEAQVKLDRAAWDQKKRGQIFGLIIGLVAFATAIIMTLKGSPLAGGFIGSSGVIGLVAVFVLGRRPSKDSSENQDQTADQA